MQVRCTMDEPLQLLMDKLASKSGDLYIFWVLSPPRSKTTTSFITPITTKWQNYSVFSRKTTCFGSNACKRNPTVPLLKRSSIRKDASTWKKASRISKLR